ncbi:ROK family protein [Candidatus Symbiobacter mobilis]|uniref:Transcriptional regulator n=1 Tax=Candidatus Symbiobacter mobilis CR TaxID=946483 RepID=U5N9N7_9BURK|nr:ROK family protein [Candidatus Symbiobacter mobilis]AGX88122.1 transcriptional regulator [Candidatus Symbiobacter mobilis CR]
MNQATPCPPFPSLPPGSAPVACVDIGGTKVAVHIADADGECAKIVEPTVVQGSRDALAKQVIGLIERAAAQAKLDRKQISRVGVASCGPFVVQDGFLELAAPNLCGGLANGASGLPNDWLTAPIEAPLRELFPFVRVENDAVGALEAERRWGALHVAGSALRHCAYVTWSTGIGTGLCVEGRVLRGKNGNAGHAGHIFVSRDDSARCGCGNLGDVEGLVSGSAITRRFGPMGYANAASLFNAAYAGDARAVSIIDDLCDIMGRMLYNLIATLDLERISIGGSVYWHHRDYLLPRLRRVVQGKLPALTDGCEIVSVGLGDRVGDYGALALVA